MRSQVWIFALGLLFLLGCNGTVQEESILNTVTAKIDEAIAAIPTVTPAATSTPILLPIPVPTATPHLAPTPQPAPTPLPTSTPQPTPTPPLTATPQPTATPLVFRPPFPTTEVIVSARQAIAHISGRRGNHSNQGTGFYIGEQWILTNEHVIRGHLTVTVELDSGNLRDTATVVGWHKPKDIAVLRLSQEPGVSALSFQATKGLPPGRQVLLLGYPLDIRGEPAATSGILARSVDHPVRGQVLETDVLASPGNSGGLLLDRDAKVIGVAFAFRTDPLELEKGLTLVLAADEVLTILKALQAGARVES